MPQVFARMRINGQAVFASFTNAPATPPGGGGGTPPTGGGSSSPGALPDRVVKIVSGITKKESKPDSTSPNIRDAFSSVESLAMRALRRYGEFSPSTASGDVLLVMIDLANEVLDEIHVHPYWSGVLPYYAHQSDARSVPDTIMLAGLLAKFARDRGSSKAMKYEAEYLTRMNTVLYTRKFGTPDRIEVNATDMPAGGKW